jgi:hypothetical protein
MSTKGDSAVMHTSGLKFLYHCFSGIEWSYLTSQEEFRERLFQINSPKDAEPLVKLGLSLLDRDQRMEPLALRDWHKARIWA